MDHSIQSLQAYIGSLYSGVGKNVKGQPTGVIVPYVYPLYFAALAAAGIATQQLPMQANADFLCTGLSYHANIAAAAQVVGTKTVANCEILITDTGSNQQWTQSAVDLENYASNDAKLRPLPYPRLVQGRSALSVVVNNYDAAATYNIKLAFTGVLIYIYQ